MDGYDVTKATRLIASFTIDHLSNWYVRRCRRRFWKSEMNANKLSAYQTLYECLITVCKLSAPFVPFTSEEIFSNLNNVTKLENVESIHLSNFPKPGYRDLALEEKMDIAQRVVTMGRAMRAKHNMKVRQPLLKMMVAVDESKRDALAKMNDVILEELNIKEMIVLTDDAGIVQKSAKPNFKAIGPKHGKKANPVANAIRALTGEQIEVLEKGSSITVPVDGADVEIAKEDVEIIRSEIQGWIVQNEEGITVALDTELNSDLVAEGIAREFVNRVQNLRKDSGFDVTDRIEIKYSAPDDLAAAVKQFEQYISNETLAAAFRTDGDFEFSVDAEIDDKIVNISIKKYQA